MARQNKHPTGKPTGLSLSDLQRRAEPAAYLTVDFPAVGPPVPCGIY